MSFRPFLAVLAILVMVSSARADEPVAPAAPEAATPAPAAPEAATPAPAAPEAAAEAPAADAAAIKKVVKKKSAEVKSCYESELAANPALAGKVNVAFTIASGSVTAASVGENATGNAALGECLIGKVKTWKFPADVSGDVSWPFLFAVKS